MKNYKIYNSKTITTSINRDWKTVYEFVHNPDNFPQWAKSAFQSIKQIEGEWIAETMGGMVKVIPTKRNDYGVVDHNITTPSGIDVFIPMRVIQNGDGTELIFTLYHTTDISYKNYLIDIKSVESDLRNLKNIMEKD